jgi:hypothetical protein
LRHLQRRNEDVSIDHFFLRVQALLKRLVIGRYQRFFCWSTLFWTSSSRFEILKRLVSFIFNLYLEVKSCFSEIYPPGVTKANIESIRPSASNLILQTEPSPASFTRSRRCALLLVCVFGCLTAPADPAKVLL